MAAATVLALMVSGPAVRTPGAQAPSGTAPAPWREWVESDFPFFSSVVDARAGGVGAADNLTPRALVLNLGSGAWAAFDLDLLRVAAVWTGEGLSPVALAPGSYRHPDRKTPGGQSPLSQPVGSVLLANGIYPGIQTGERPAFVDPREPAPSPEEVGRGPLPESLGRFGAVRFQDAQVVLEYLAGGTAVQERFSAVVRGGAVTVQRRVRVAASTSPLMLVAGRKAAGADVRLTEPGERGVTLAAYDAAGGEVAARAASASSTWMVHIPPRRREIELALEISSHNADLPLPPDPRPRSSGRRWPGEVVTAVTPSSSSAPFVVDDIGLPLDNPWKRNVRPGDIQFLSDGTGVVITLDGDVWLVRGLGGEAGTARWTRFTSGLHEPLTLAVREDEIYAFDRNGIWRLRDTDANGEADVHELFSNAFAQTADMREFPSTIRLAPRGEFVIAKGGQEAATLGKHNGSILRISADGRSATVLGYGFRQPNLSVDPVTGLVITSDQQGHYIPTTPLHIVRDRQFYGFLGSRWPKEAYPAPIAEPLTWIPHAANASAMSQVWLHGAKMGPLTGELVHIGFNNPELFHVLFNRRTPRLQAAVVSVTRAFDFPPLNGSVNPADGQLYLAGFQILGWGTTATRLAGLGRVRYTGRPFAAPREVVPMNSGVLLRFDQALHADSASNPDNYSVSSWGYRRTANYGSPQYREDGTTGIDQRVPSGAYLSKDRRAVFVAVPGMKPAMQMRVSWTVRTAAGDAVQDTAYFTPYELARFDPVQEGFGAMEVDLRPRASAAVSAGPASAEEGSRLSQLYGCRACHGVEPDAPARLGPNWWGLYGSARSYARGALRTTADEAYLRESILDPPAKVVSGFERSESGMPSYAGVLTDNQIESIILYLKSLR